MKTHYEKVVREAMAKKFGYKNAMQMPRSRRSCSTWASARPSTTARRSTAPPRTCRLIAGQKPVHHPARKAIATYKLREGMAIGAKVTLRGDRMYEFLDRLVTIALPRVKDFRGPQPEELRRPRQLRLRPEGAHRVPRDRLRQGRPDLGHGRDRVHVGEVNDDEARALLRGFNFPFRS